MVTFIELLATAVLADYRWRNGRDRENEGERMEGKRNIHNISVRGKGTYICERE